MTITGNTGDFYKLSVCNMNQSLAGTYSHLQLLSVTQAAVVIVIIVITAMLPVAGQKLVHIVTMYNVKQSTI